jgi:hypothetical protein
MSSEDLVKKLRDSIEEGEWSWLAPHHARGAVVIVSPELDLAEVGSAVARDDVAEVGPWLQQGHLAKPTTQQAESWDATAGQKFRFLIVQPYVLIQSLAH